jgi:hypothetical protein
MMTADAVYMHKHQTDYESNRHAAAATVSLAEVFAVASLLHFDPTCRPSNWSATLSESETPIFFLDVQ